MRTERKTTTSWIIQQHSFCHSDIRCFTLNVHRLSLSVNIKKQKRWKCCAIRVLEWRKQTYDIFLETMEIYLKKHKLIISLSVRTQMTLLPNICCLVRVNHLCFKINISVTWWTLLNALSLQMHHCPSDIGHLTSNDYNKTPGVFSLYTF